MIEIGVMTIITVAILFYCICDPRPYDLDSPGSFSAITPLLWVYTLAVTAPPDFGFLFVLLRFENQLSAVLHGLFPQPIYRRERRMWGIYMFSTDKAVFCASGCHFSHSCFLPFHKLHIAHRGTHREIPAQWFLLN